MRTFVWMALGAFALPAATQPLFDPSLLESIAHSEAHGHVPAPKANGAPARGYDITYHRLQLELDPAVRYISGTVEHRFRATTSLTEVVLDLNEPLVVSSITSDGIPLTFVHEQGTLTVQLPSAMEEGENGTLLISYAGEPADSGFGSFVRTEHEGTPILWTLSEPLGARDWWPCKQDLNDKADSLDVLVTVPAGQRVASNGLLVEESVLPDGNVLYHWRHRHPINYYLVAVAVTNYVAYSDFVPLPSSTVEVLNYVFPENLASAQNETPRVIEQMQLFSQLFGEYPFADEKYGHAQFPWGGGMEHQTMSFMGNFSYELMAHELAHQWFGNAVTCGSWQDVWLNEGFATYLSGLCYEFLEPQWWMPFKKGRRDFIISEPDGSVLRTDTTSVSSIFSSRLTYAKGAMVLHMLRGVCGDSAFFAGVNNYFHDPAIFNGSARTPQLVAHLEAASGVDLSDFMQSWFVGEGYPTYQLTWHQDNNNMVDLSLEQSTSHPSVSFFAMPVPLRFWSGGQDSTVVLDHSFSGQSFQVALNAPVDSVQLDPDIWIVCGSSIVTKVAEGPVPPVNSFQVHPNPVRDLLHVDVKGLASPRRWSIRDGLGRIVDQGTWVGDAIPVKTLAPGMHVLELELPEGHGTTTARFIKE